ncbi:hypothetical protein OG417_36205 [Actinoallomurus sp. NBC_01490]|uniref:hypothetical protein n=1 Tax=Actinoallomurus sp. NBC_01490 TaxID=2903557 RepID=UPI002E2FFEE9|nr:hypothetical protein [Actinoallomurus sp. NBC_01490]
MADLMLAMISLMFISWGEGMVRVPGVLFLLFLVVANSIFVVSLARHYGRAFWLDGRVLIRRSVTGRKYYDLSVAHVRAESVAPRLSSHPFPRLVVEQPGRTPVRLWLREPARKGALLPPGQLVALARAIDPGMRHPIARRLYELAADPLGGAY